MVLRRFSLSAVISIHTLRMEGDWDVSSTGGRADISIHTLRMEGDLPQHGLAGHPVISIHTLRMEGDGGRCQI